MTLERDVLGQWGQWQDTEERGGGRMVAAAKHFSKMGHSRW